MRILYRTAWIKTGGSSLLSNQQTSVEPDILSGGQTLTGSRDPSFGDAGCQPKYDGVLLYIAPGNCRDVSITGNGTSRYVGTVLAPCSNVKLAGGSSTGNQNVLENQIIADTITLTGSNTLNINFNSQQQWQPPVPPAIEMTK